MATGAAAAALLGSAAAALLWLVAGLALGSAHRFVDVSGCSVAPGLLPPEPLADALLRGAVLGGLLGGAVIALLTLARRDRSRRAGTPSAVWHDTLRAVLACAAAAALLSQALPRRAAGDGYTAIFLPRADLSAAATTGVGVADGLVVGLQVGLAAGLALGLVAAVVTASPAMRLPSRAGLSRWRWAPAAPLRPTAVLAPLALSAVLVAVTVQALADGRGVPWPVSLLAVPLASWLLLHPRSGSSSHRVRGPEAALREDRRFALAAGGAVLLVGGPLALPLILLPDVGVAFYDDASGARVAACLLATVVTCAVVVACAVATDPLLRATDAWLRRSGHASAPLEVVVATAHERGLLRTVGPAFQFRHRRLLEHLASPRSEPAER